MHDDSVWIKSAINGTARTQKSNRYNRCSEDDGVETTEMAAETRAAPLSEAEPDVDEAAGGARRALTGKRCILLSSEVQLHFHVACYQQ